MKPTLATSTEMTHRVEYHDLDKFVNEVFDFDTKPKPGHYHAEGYCFVAHEEASNDSVYEYNVEPKQLDSKELADFTSTNGMKTPFLVDDLLDELCYRNLILPGTYIVSVCW